MADYRDYYARYGNDLSAMWYRNQKWKQDYYNKYGNELNSMGYVTPNMSWEWALNVLSNIMWTKTNWTPTGNKSSDSLLNIVTGYLNGTNWTPTGSSRTPTTNAWNTYWWDWLIWKNWKVVYNPQNFNWQAYKPFSVADTLAQRAQWYQAQGLEWLANSFRTLNRENNAYNNTANRITDYYTALANDINSRENALAQRKESLANQLSQDIANQRQYVMDYFGPNWIFTNEINKFYDENGNYLASEAGRQMAMANAEWIQSGASLWAQRAARNEAYNNAFQNYLKVKEQELSAKMNIQTQLINYMKALREEYGNTQNTYIISQYQRANDLLNAISANLADSQNQIALAQLQKATASSGWSSSNILQDALVANREIIRQYWTDTSKYPEWVLNQFISNNYIIDAYRWAATEETKEEWTKE